MLLNSHAYAQATYQKAFGGPGDELNSYCVSTEDGGCIMVGQTTSFGAGGSDVSAIKLDSNHDIQWSKTFGGILDESLLARTPIQKIELTADKGCVIAGFTQSFGQGNGDAYLIRLDSMGTLLWSKTYGQGQEDFFTTVFEMPDGGFMLGGSTTIGLGSRDFYLLRTDYAGSIIWTKTLGGPDHDYLHDMNRTGDGGFILAGASTGFGPGVNDGVLCKVDSLGNLKWIKAYGGSNIEGLFSVVQTGDGGYIAAGRTETFGAGNFDGWIVKTDSLGNLQWSKAYGGTGLENLDQIILGQHGGYAAVGETESFGAGLGDVFMVLIDSQGNLLESKAYGGGGAEFARSLEFVGNSQYYISGSTQSFGAGGWDFYCIHTDTLGNSGCNEEDIISVVTNVTPTVTQVALSRTPTGGMEGVPATQVNIPAYLDSMLCVPLATQLLFESDGFDTSRQDTCGMIFDRFGNRYSLGDLKRVPHSHGGGHASAGIFELDFTGAAFGFNPFTGNQTIEAVTAPLMRATITQVFKDVSAMLNHEECNEMPSEVNIEIQSYGIPAGALASATSFYAVCHPEDNTGIIHGEVWKAINTGINGPELDGFMNVNFNFPWNFSADGIPNPIPQNLNDPPGEFDLYSVILHEVLHLLGFNSLINGIGGSRSGLPGTLFYNTYDTYLNWEDNPPGPIVPFLTWDNCYDAQFTAGIPAITSTCTEVSFNGTAGPQPVHAPAAYQGGSSLHHFENGCGGNNNYVMNPFIGIGDFHKVPTLEEVLTLQDIGYSTTGTFGDGTLPFLTNGDPFHAQGIPIGGVIVAGLNDGYGLTCDSQTLTVESCSTLTISPLDNDKGVANGTFECLRLLPASPGIVTGGITTGTTFNYDPQGTTGVMYFTYIPVSSTGVRGNTTCGRVIITPCGGVSCATPQVCNQICNPVFDVPNCPSCATNAPDPFTSGEVDGWQSSHGTPHISGFSGPNPSAVMWSRGDNRTGEGILAYVDVKVNEKYIFSYFRRATPTGLTGPVHANLDNAYVRLLNSANAGPGFPSFDAAIPLPGPGPGPNMIILHERNVQISPDLTQVTVCFTADGDYNWLWIYPDQFPGNGTAFLNVDDVTLIQDDFGLNDINITCEDQFIGGPFCEVLNTSYEWRNDVQSGIIGTDDTYFLKCENGTINYELTRIFPPNPSSVFIPSVACPKTANMTVTIINPLSVKTAVLITPPCGAFSGQINASVTGGTAPYTYLWHQVLPAPATVGDQVTPLATGLPTGEYLLSVTDASGCCIETTVILSGNLAIAMNGTSTTCENACDGTATAVPAGAAPFTYQWDDILFQTGPTASTLCAGMYHVYITDATGCSGVEEITIIDADNLGVDLITTDATCPLGNNGSITATVSGGTPFFQYQWNDPAAQTTATASNLPSGWYGVTVTDANGCTVSADQGVGIIGNLSIVINFILPGCNGGSDGQILAIPDGTAPYNVLWDTDPFQTSLTATALTANTYNVTVTDDNGCTGTASLALPDPPTLIVPNIAVTDVLCYGSNGGSIDLSLAGGTAPYTFLWSTTETSEDIGNLTAGEYTVSVTDATGDCLIRTVEVIEPNQLKTDKTKMTNVCGITPGSINLVIEGGTPPYTYLWDDPGASTTQDLTGLAAGIYTVIITDGNGCINSPSFTISSSPAIALNITANNVTCFGGNDGTATVDVAGGTPLFTYLWDDVLAQTNPTAEGLVAGAYYVTVTDNVGCAGTEFVIITEPSTALIVVPGFNGVSCNGFADGEASVVVSGGSAPYTYLWDDPGAQTNATAINLAGGAVTCIISDGTGCSITETINVPEPALLIATIASTINVSCLGGSDGQAGVFVTGGVTPYTYLWDDPGAQTTQTATGLVPGTYSVQVTDNSGCQASDQTIITEPAALSVSMSSTPVSCSGGSDGTATATATGGTPPYTYLWSNGQTTSTATGLTGGLYSVTVTVNNLCSESGLALVLAPFQAIATNAAITDESCPGSNDGAIDLTVLNAVSPVTYIWSTGATTQDISGLAAGSYDVTLTDGNGCVKTSSQNVGQLSSMSVTVDEARFITCTVNPTPTHRLTANVSGGTPAFTYLWDDPNAQTTQSIIVGIGGVPFGTYTVTVTDANGCTGAASGTSLRGPPFANMSPIQNPVQICDGDCAQLDASGSEATGTPPYVWLGGSFNCINPECSVVEVCPTSTTTYQVDMTDLHGCPGQENLLKTVEVFQCNPTAPDMCLEVSVFKVPGTFPCVTPSGNCTECSHIIYSNRIRNLGTDNNSCVFTFAIPPEVEYVQVAPQHPQPDGPPVNGELTWSNLCNPSFPHNLNGILINVVTEIFAQEGLCITIPAPVSAAQASITPDGGCQDDAQLSYVYNGPVDPNQKLVTHSEGQGICHTILNTDTLEYQINFQNVGTAPVKDVVIRDTLNFTALDISTVHGLWSSHDVSFFNIIGPGIMEWMLNDINLPDSGADFAGSIGTVGFRVLPEQTVAPGTVIENRAAIFFDVNFPVITNTVFNTTLGDPITITASGPTTFCFGDSLILTASTANSYLWSTGDTSQSITVTAAGDYSVIDASECLAPSDTVTVTVAPGLFVDAGACETVYFGYAPEECADLSANASGGAQPYTFLWSSGDTVQDITVCPSATTVFSITVTDANGCAASDDVTVEAVDVRCGNNNNKVQICHFPTGNPGNPQELCLSANAVANHLANHGDKLGSCDSLNPCLQAKTAPLSSGKQLNGILDEENSQKVKKGVFIKAYPNPFNNKTTIEFTIPAAQLVVLSIFNLSGERISELFNGYAEKDKPYKTEFDAKDLSGGIYFYQLIAGERTYTNKLVILKQ